MEEKQHDYRAAQREESENELLRLLYADSASVIQDCIEMIHESAREYGVPVV